MEYFNLEDSTKERGLLGNLNALKVINFLILFSKDEEDVKVTLLVDMIEILARGDNQNKDVSDNDIRYDLGKSTDK